MLFHENTHFCEENEGDQENHAHEHTTKYYKRMNTTSKKNETNRKKHEGKMKNACFLKTMRF